ncbi:MAG: hypothetical protein KAX49_03760 [Halanaerobiales bacterium]|nr:hypothetical protein [Halanaerobiales bacterium]
MKTDFKIESRCNNGIQELSEYLTLEKEVGWEALQLDYDNSGKAYWIYFKKIHFEDKKADNVLSEKDIRYEGELQRKSNNRAGFDIVQHEELLIPSRQITKIKTNIRFSNGIGNNFALVTLRSFYQDSRLLMPSVGILDSDYTDYLFITVFNSSYCSLKINKGERLAQLVFIKNNDIELIRRVEK